MTQFPAVAGQRWIRLLDGVEVPSRELIGGKASSIARMHSLGLNVPPAFVITTEANAEFLAAGTLPTGLDAELGASVAWLESRTGRCFGKGPKPLLVSVRSGAAVSMPGMMDTILNLGLTDATEAALADEFGDVRFARDTHRRFLALYCDIVLKAPLSGVSADGTPAQWRQAISAATGREVPPTAMVQLCAAIEAVFHSWNSRRAKRYRRQYDIPDSPGTAVTVQAMVFGNLDDRSGTGVLFSRNPLTGEARPYGDYLRHAQGEDVVSGKCTPEHISVMQRAEPDAHRTLLEAAQILERAASHVQDIEFTVEHGTLFLLQARNAKLAPPAAVKATVDMVREGLIDETAALGRITPEQIRRLLARRLREEERHTSPVARGEGACPGVGIGVVVTDADQAERLAASGQSVILARPTTSPNDLHGMIASVAVITEEGGGTSHAAVVSRALGIPCVVGCGQGSLLRFAGKTLTVDGQAGHIFDGALRVEVPDERCDESLVALAEWARRRSPLRVLRPTDENAVDATDLSNIGDAADPAKIATVLAGLPVLRGARGGAIASDEGVRAAVAAGLEFIVAEPVMAPLLAAVQAGFARASAPARYGS